MLCDDLLEMIGKEYLVIQEIRENKQKYKDVLSEMYYIFYRARNDYEISITQDNEILDYSDCIINQINYTNEEKYCPVIDNDFDDFDYESYFEN